VRAGVNISLGVHAMFQSCVIDTVQAIKFLEPEQTLFEDKKHAKTKKGDVLTRTNTTLEEGRNM
jgi:hypothetical protein